MLQINLKIHSSVTASGEQSKSVAGEGEMEKEV